MHFLDLNEDVLREIFLYLEYDEVFYVLGNVCKQLKETVDTYIQLGGVFLLCSVPGMPSKLLHIFERNSRIVSICSKLGPALPRPSLVDSLESNVTFDIGSFGCRLKEKNVVGVYYTEKPKHLNFRLNEVADTYKFCYFHEYEPRTNSWIPIESRDKSELYSWTDTLWRQPYILISTCPIADSMMVVLEEYKNNGVNYARLFHLNCKEPRKAPKKTSKHERFLKAIKLVTKTETPCYTYSEQISLPLDLQGIFKCTIVQVEYDKFMLIGGSNNQQVPNMKIWQGKVFRENNTTWKHGTSGKITWSPINIELHEPLASPLCFKLKNNLYIAGGATTENPSGCLHLSSVDIHGKVHYFCHRYDMKNKEYYDCEYILPLSVNSFDKVTTSADEKFAIILTKEKGTILIFTEKDGFSEFPNFSIFGKRSVKKPFFYNPSTTVLLRVK